MHTETIEEQWKPQHFSLSFDSLNVTWDEVARFVGYSEDTISTAFVDQINALIQQAPNHVTMEGGFRVLPSETVSIERDTFSIEDTCFDTGRIIAGPLRGANTLALFVATAGKGLTQWSNELLERQEPVAAYFVDVLGSVSVEKAADFIEAQINQWAHDHDEGASNRYSPGYCEWSVLEQHKLFSFLPEAFCGISLTESALMQPTKSVSGVIGVGGNAKKRAYACSICDMEDCFRRNMGH